jgi:hypothetical protein
MQKSTRPPLSEESITIGFTVQELKPKFMLLSIVVIFPATKCRPNTWLQATWPRLFERTPNYGFGNPAKMVTI